jgi:integrase
MATGKIKAKTAKDPSLKPGRYGDGESLYLVVTPGGTRNWVFLYDVKVGEKKVRRELGLGGFDRDGEFTAQRDAARAKADAHRAILKAGQDPKLKAIEDAKTAAQAREAQAAADKKAAAIASVNTFKAVAETFLEDNEPGWKNDKHRQQWRNTLATYAGPLMAKAVHSIATDDVLAVLRPIWIDKPETASRVRQRIERVLTAAKARGLRSGDNPAAWRGHLEGLLPKRRKDTKSNHAALPFSEVPDFVGRLRAADGLAAMMLEFTILTATRTGEVIGARWSEVDLAGAVWTIPKERMKAKAEHRVPLSARSVEILEAVRPLKRSDSGAVFPGGSAGGGLSNMAMAMLLKRLGREDITVHGFRSTFRDWAAETTGFPHEVCEMALAHTIRNKAEAAYRRGDLFEKRSQLMAAWAAYCEPAEAGSVITPLRNAG